MTATVQRDESISRVIDNAQPWSDRAAAEIRKMTKWTGTAEDMRHALRLIVGEPHHPNAWGGLIMGAVKRGDLIKTGRYRKMKDAKSHARSTPVYMTGDMAKSDVLVKAGKRAYEARADNKFWRKWEELPDYAQEVWVRVAKAVMEG